MAGLARTLNSASTGTLTLRQAQTQELAYIRIRCSP